MVLRILYLCHPVDEDAQKGSEGGKRNVKRQRRRFGLSIPNGTADRPKAELKMFAKWNGKRNRRKSSNAKSF